MVSRFSHVENGVMRLPTGHSGLRLASCVVSADAVRWVPRPGARSNRFYCDEVYLYHFSFIILVHGLWSLICVCVFMIVMESKRFVASTTLTSSSGVGYDEAKAVSSEEAEQYKRKSERDHAIANEAPLYEKLKNNQAAKDEEFRLRSGFSEFFSSSSSND